MEFSFVGCDGGDNDPDLGLIKYNVDPLGQTYSQVSPKQAKASPQQRTSFAYDLLGRMIERQETDLDSFWTFDTAANGIGQLAEAYTLAGTRKDYTRVRTYDDKGRPDTTSQTIENRVYASRMATTRGEG